MRFTTSTPTLIPDGGTIMREKTIEQKLVNATKIDGGLAPKFVSPGFDGMPETGAAAGGQNRLCGSQGTGQGTETFAGSQT